MVPICSIDKFRCTRAFCFLTSLIFPFLSITTLFAGLPDDKLSL